MDLIRSVNRRIIVRWLGWTFHQGSWQYRCHYFVIFLAKYAMLFVKKLYALMDIGKVVYDVSYMISKRDLNYFEGSSGCSPQWYKLKVWVKVFVFGRKPCLECRRTVCARTRFSIPNDYELKIEAVFQLASKTFDLWLSIEFKFTLLFRI